MTWKIKILDVKKNRDDHKHIYIYFGIYRYNPDKDLFEEFFKGSEKLKQEEVNEKSGKVNTKDLRKKFIKKFIKQVAQPIIDTFKTNEGLSELIGYEEII